MNRQIKTNIITPIHCFIILFAFLVGVQVFISNRIATSGKLISQLEQKAIDLEDQNRKLLSENVEALSLQKLYQKAQEMGFAQPLAVVQMGDETKDLAMKN